MEGTAELAAPALKAAKRRQEAFYFIGAGCPFPSDPPTEIISFTLMLGALKAA
jgi:hypothetical protein